ncbi:MAG: type II toxin-antitoxin system RelE/ParE family toxin [Aeromonas sp.]
MSDEQPEIDVFESVLFSKQLKKLPPALLKLVEDEIDKIIDDPEFGEQKAGSSHRICGYTNSNLTANWCCLAIHGKAPN